MGNGKPFTTTEEFVNTYRDYYAGRSKIEGLVWAADIIMEEAKNAFSCGDDNRAHIIRDLSDKLGEMAQKERTKFRASWPNGRPLMGLTEETEEE